MLLRILFSALAVALLVASAEAATATTSPSPDAVSAAAPARAAAAAACKSNGNYVWAHLGACGWAGPGNTGARPTACPSHRLKARGTNARNVIHVTHAGAVVACQRIVGCLSIEAPRVTVHDVAIRCTSGKTGENANGTAVISVRRGDSARLAHVSINGMRGVHACVWHEGLRLTMANVNCAYVNDGVFSWSFARTSSGNNFTITDSYFHNFTERTANGHIDGYQTEGASHGLIQHNTYLMTSDAGNESDSAVAIWDSLRSSTDITVKHNLISGGGFSVYAEDYSPSEAHPAGGFSVTNTHFVGNVFSKHLYGCVGYYGIWFTRGRPTDGWHRTGNTILETRGNVDARNPYSGGRLCT